MSKLFCLVFVAFLGVGCQLGGGTEVPTPIPPTPAAAAGAIENSAVTTDTQSEFSVEPLVIPAPASGTGVVHGTLVRQSTQTPFLGGVELYLAALVPSDNEVMRVAGLDTEQAPRGTLNAEGAFVFADVPPGEYALAVSTPIGALLVPDPNESGRDLLLTVTENQTIDLGTLSIDLPF